VTIFKHRESRTFSTLAPVLFSYCVDALSAIGAQIEKQDLELGIVEATDCLQGWLAPDRVGILITIAQKPEGTAELEIETWMVPRRSNRESWLGADQPEKVSQRILTRVADASAIAYVDGEDDHGREVGTATAAPAPPEEPRLCPNCQAANLPTDSRCEWCGGTI
jgi:hypothetical protein